MAILKKSGARKNLAEGSIAISRGVSFAGEPQFTISIPQPETGAWFRVTLSRGEALRFIEMVAGGETEPANFIFDKRTVSEKLRALADKSESEK